MFWLYFEAKINQIKSNLSLYSLYYGEACNELAVSISLSALATHLLSKKSCSGGEPLAKLSLNWPAQDLNLRGRMQRSH